jgi:Putative restriction endonuclease
MSALLTPPSSAPPSSGLRPFVWTVPLFHHLGELGVFRGRRPKLIHGVLLEQGMMNPPHAIAGEKAEEALRVAFGTGWRVRVQKPLVLGQTTDPEPDIAVVRGTPGALVHPTSAELVVEIADTTLASDVTEMAELYATAGIADYWVLDVDGRQLLVFRDPVPLPAGLGTTAYRTRQTVGETGAIAPLAVPSAAVRVADLLP